MEILEAAASWRDRVELDPHTLKNYRYSLNSLVRSGVVRVEDVGLPSVDRWLAAERARGVSPKRCNRHLSALLSLLKWLERSESVDWTLRPRLRVLRFREIGGQTPRFLDAPAEYEPLRRACWDFRELLGIACEIAVHVGLRLSELRRLQREDLMLRARPHPFVRVLRTHGRTNKTNRDRTVPLTVEFASRLCELGLEGSGPVLPAGGRGATTPYLSVTTFERWFSEARERVALGDVTWTTLRHTFASWNIQEGVEIAKVAKWMGNSIHVCMKHYVGLIPGGDPDIDRGVGAVLARAAAPTEKTPAA